MINIGKNLKMQRELRKKSMQDIQKAIKISTANQTRWENNKVIPNIQFCILLADYYGISLDELVGRDFY